MTRATINSDTFEKVFKDKEELLGQMISSLTRLDYNKFKNNITCNKKNISKVDYFVEMQNDNVIVVTNTKTKEIIVINLKK